MVVRLIGQNYLIAMQETTANCPIITYRSYYCCCFRHTVGTCSVIRTRFRCQYIKACPLLRYIIAHIELMLPQSICMSVTCITTDSIHIEMANKARRQQLVNTRTIRQVFKSIYGRIIRRIDLIPFRVYVFAGSIKQQKRVLVTASRRDAGLFCCCQLFIQQQRLYICCLCSAPPAAKTMTVDMIDSRFISTVMPGNFRPYTSSSRYIQYWKEKMTSSTAVLSGYIWR